MARLGASCGRAPRQSRRRGFRGAGRGLLGGRRCLGLVQVIARALEPGDLALELGQRFGIRFALGDDLLDEAEAVDGGEVVLGAVGLADVAKLRPAALKLIEEVNFDG